ncbi:MAG TPA: hypothetical protein P5050_11445 [Bacteroidia bacterium]|nr:hypothetical protein [Sphingobacteriales bacterium]HPD66105.1 hypothetical protein [Bacteroidia bacterium]HRS59819.1 hypothetical protein [Bacteroidia bacterium]HRU69208.1 hypothetical protein [Bacteroidia bacterium]
MKNLYLIIAVVMGLAMSSCFSDYLYVVEEDPTVPTTYDGRTVDVQGTVYVKSRNVTFYVWDSGTIDDDNVTLVVNGNVILSGYTLTADKKAISYTLSNYGYNYVILYANNEGSIPPNTCALSIDDGNGEQTLVLSADLSTNGAYNIYVEK